MKHSLLSKKKRTRVPSSSIEKTKTPISISKIPGTENLLVIKSKSITFHTDGSLFQKGRKETEKDFDNQFYSLRYYFFSLYDKGIAMDEESWYSVTPEEIAVYISKIIPQSQSFSITDAFCGCGGNTIQFSKTFSQVNAVDISQEKINLTKNNCQVYNCRNNINYFCQDFLTFNSKSDFIFLSPPWGGVEYKNDSEFKLKNWITPDIEKIIQHSFELSQNLIFYLPRTTDITELVEYISKFDEGEDHVMYLDVRSLVSAGKVKAMLCCYGNFFNSVTVKDIKTFIRELFKNIKTKTLVHCIDLSKVLGFSFVIKEIFNGEKKGKKDLDQILKVIFENMDEEEKQEYYELMEEKKHESEKKTELESIITPENIPNITGILSAEEYNKIINL